MWPFQKKKTDSEKIIDELGPKIFPGGKKQIENGTNVVCSICSGKLNKDEARGLYTRSESILFISEDKSSQMITKSIIKFSQGKINQVDAEKIYKFLLVSQIKRSGIKEKLIQKFGKEKIEGLSDDQIFELMSENITAQTGVESCNLDEIPSGFGEFGLVATNPIPVKGIRSNEIYLKSLITTDRCNISYIRKGSLTSSNINNPIDEYEIYDENNTYISTIYICPYHQKISEIAPKGFRFREG